MQYRQADWNDVKSVVGTSGTDLQTFKNSTNMVDGNKYLITYGGQIRTTSNYPYYLTIGSSGLDSLQGSIAVGSTSYFGGGNTATGSIICVKTSTSNPF